MAIGGADVLAKDLADSLIENEDFGITIPDFTGAEFNIPSSANNELFVPVTKLTNEDLTTKSLTGTGTFDALMQAFKVHLKVEFEAGRITGEQYTKAYIALVESAMGNATQYLLGKDAAYWNAVAAQMQARRAEVEAVTARVALESEKTKLQALRYDALTSKAGYLLSKLRLATESVQYDTLKFSLDQIMPVQKDAALKDIERSTQEISNLTKQGVLLDQEAAMQPQKIDMLAKQILGVVAQNALTTKQMENIQQDINLGPDKLALLKKQVLNQEAQTTYVGKQGLMIDKEIELFPTKRLLMEEQIEVQRGQTMDTRTDGTVITGTVGKQKDLYSQQITSYQRDHEMKAAKVFVDAWVVMKTVDEGLAPPTMFSNANLDGILTKVKTNNGL